MVKEERVYVYKIFLKKADKEEGKDTDEK